MTSSKILYNRLVMQVMVKASESKEQLTSEEIVMRIKDSKTKAEQAKGKVPYRRRKMIPTRIDVTFALKRLGAKVVGETRIGSGKSKLWSLETEE